MLQKLLQSTLTLLWKEHLIGPANFPLNSVVLFLSLSNAMVIRLSFYDLLNNISEVAHVCRLQKISVSVTLAAVPSPTSSDLPPSDARPSPSHGYRLQSAER